MGLRETIRAAGRGMTKVRAAETSKAEEDDEDKMDESAEADDENDDEATASTASTDAGEDGNEDGDEDDDDDDDEDGAKSARMSERRRIQSILKCAEAGTSLDLAMELAFETGMSASAAIKLLKAAARGGGAKTSTLGGRMKTEGNPKLGTGGEDDDAAGGDKPEGRLLALAKARKAQRAA